MHAVFMINGRLDDVAKFLKWMDTRMGMMPFKNPKLHPSMKDKNGNILAEGVQPIDMAIRHGLFGTWEMTFPEGHKDEVLTTLRFQHQPGAGTKYNQVLLKAKLLALRKLLSCEPIPEFNTDKEMLLPDGLMENLRIIPIGVRYDEVREVGSFGLVHESI